MGFIPPCHDDEHEVMFRMGGMYCDKCHIVVTEEDVARSCVMGEPLKFAIDRAFHRAAKHRRELMTLA